MMSLVGRLKELTEPITDLVIECLECIIPLWIDDGIHENCNLRRTIILLLYIAIYVLYPQLAVINFSLNMSSAPKAMTI